MITKEQALTLKHGQFVYFTVPMGIARWRITGKVQTWKTRPEEFCVPIKYGLFTHGHLTQENARHYYMTEAEATFAMEVLR